MYTFNLSAVQFLTLDYDDSRIRQDVDILLQDDGSFTHTDYEIANTLNKFFASVFTNEPTEEIPVLPDRTNGCSLQNIDLTHQDIINQLNQPKTHKSCGPDNCHPHVLKEIKNGLIAPIYYLFRQSLAESTLPSSWKQAIVTAIHKK